MKRYLSFFFNKDYRLPMKDIASVMTKLADEERGHADERGIDKRITEKDDANIQKAVAQCRELLKRLGVPEE